MFTPGVRIFVMLLVFYPITSSSLELNGAGSESSAQIFSSWSARYALLKPGITINYQTTKAIEAVSQVESGKADFCEVDAPLTQEELQKKGLSQFPYTLSAITPIINIPGVLDGQLRLDGETLGDIFSGKINKWNDQAIRALNPGMELPDEAIHVAHQTEGGGTFAMNSYLAKVNPKWRSTMRAGENSDWPVGAAVENPQSMANYVKKTSCSIGYSEITYARQHGLVYVRLKNKAGAWVSPHMGSVEAADDKVAWTSDNGFCEAMTDESGEGSWPIASASYLIIKKTSNNIERRLALLGFLGWGLRSGGLDVTRLDLLPIKSTVVPKIFNSWNDTPLSLEGATVVNAEQVKQMITKGLTIIDARVRAEYVAGHIPTARNVYYTEKSAKSADFDPREDSFDLSKLPSDKTAGMVFYCNAGACWKGYKAASAAIHASYKNVYWFRGGVPEWKERGYHLE